MIKIRKAISKSILGNAAVCFLLLPKASIAAIPRLELNQQPVWNFGCVTNFGITGDRTELTHDFVIRNTGDAPLQIYRVLSSCNVCLSAEMDKMETPIPPGSSNFIHCRLDLRLLSGSVSRAVLVECNDPKNSSLTLFITGAVMPVYQVVPPGVSIDLSQGQKAATAEILPLVPLRAKLSLVSCDDTNIDATVSSVPSSKFLLSVRLKTLPPHGDSGAQLILHSGDSNDPPCYVTVAVHHPEDLELLPPSLVFQPQVGEQMRILWVRQHGTNQLTLLDAISPSKKYFCEIEPIPFSQDYRIYLTTKGQESAAGQTNFLVLKLKNSLNIPKNLNVPIVFEAP